ncbi:MAG: hypothetical protein WBP26_04055 [Candidatus Saccharimonadales bacterium]
MAKHEQITFPEGHMAEVLDFKEPLANREVTEQINAANRRSRTYETAVEEQQAENKLIKEALAAQAADIYIPPATVTDIDPYLLEKNLGITFDSLPKDVGCDIKALPLLLTPKELGELAKENFRNTGGDLSQTDGTRVTKYGNIVVNLMSIPDRF